MKKSEIYHILQELVLDDDELFNSAKLPILRELFAQEDMAKLMEEAQEKQEAVEG